MGGKKFHRSSGRSLTDPPGTLADPQSQHRAGADEPPTRAEDGWLDQSVTALLQHWTEGPIGSRVFVAPFERVEGGSVVAVVAAVGGRIFKESGVAPKHKKI